MLICVFVGMAESSSSVQSILHPHYDNQHRGMLMAERGQVMRMQHVTLLMVERGDVDVYAMRSQVFEPLRLRCHSVHITKNMKKK